jgi:hypothetical protein
MTLLKKCTLQVGLVAIFFCNGAIAAYIDFTDDSTGLSGMVDGIGFTLSSSPGGLNFNEDYDGDAFTGCGVGQLACENDGVGIGNDEITMGQTLNLIFDTAVRITSIEFLDLYKGTYEEQATVTIDGGTPFSVNATETSGDGGYANLSLAALVGPGQNIAFTARDFYGDDGNNDYALASITVSAVPIPAAIWLFGTALIGLIGFTKRGKAA